MAAGPIRGKTMKTRTMLPLFAAMALAACAAQPPLPGASLPADAVVGAGDPLRTALSNTSNAFGSPERMAGRPDQAARALAQMEFLAIEMQGNPRLMSAGSIATAQFVQARDEWRRALGIPAAVPPQPVIDQLYASARALGSGQSKAAATALQPAVFTQGGRATLTRLGALPALPLTNQAAVAATDIMRRQDGQGRGRF